jgi:hypothetical protein
VGRRARPPRRSRESRGEAQGREPTRAALGRSVESVGRCAREAGQDERGARKVQRGAQVRAELEATQRSARSGGIAPTYFAMGLPVLRALSRVYMPSPLPRRSGWDPICSLHSPSRISLPRLRSRVDLRIVLFEDCSVFNRVTACTRAPSPYFVTVSPKASTVSLPPQLLRLHPAGAFCRVGLSPTGKRRLFTAHPQSGHRPRSAAGRSRSTRS